MFDASMFDTVCTIPLPHDLFTQAIHPTEPIVSVGLASGHVYTYRLPDGASDDGEVDASLASLNGFGHVDTKWKTRRHKESCRTLAFGIEGRQLYSAGTDGIVKAAHVETGQVEAKIAIPRNLRTGGLDHPCLLHALSPQSLILATDSSSLYVYDLRALNPKTSPKPQQTFHPHDDYISSLTPLPPTSESTSGFSKQWVSTGGTTLAVTDLRRGVMVRSEDQEEELLSSVMVTGLGTRGTSVGEKVVVGGANGVLTLWERGVWDDQDERITVDWSQGGGESLDTLALLPESVSPGGKVVVVGMGNGGLRFAKIGPNRVIAELRHDEFQNEPVVGLGFDVSGRMISGGGKMVKVWHDKGAPLNEDDEEEDEERRAEEGLKRAHEDGSDEDSEEDAESSEDEKISKKRKKRKRNKNKNSPHSNGILGFSGL